MSSPFRLGDPLPEYQKPVFIKQDTAVRYAPIIENKPLYRDTISPSCSDSICKVIANAVIAVCYCLTCPFRWIFSLFQSSPQPVAPSSDDDSVSDRSSDEAKNEKIVVATEPKTSFPPI